MNNDNMIKETIRYAFLSDWVKEATHEEIIEKLIQNDERGKQLEAYENMRKEVKNRIEYTNFQDVENLEKFKSYLDELINILNKVGDSND